MEDDLRWKTTSDGRLPQKTNSGTSQQPLIGSYSIFKLQLLRQQNIIKSLKLRLPSIEDDTKISKVEYGIIFIF